MATAFRDTIVQAGPVLSPPSARFRFARIASLALAAGVFLIDLNVELGVSTYVLYLPGLALAALVPGRRFVVSLAAAATLLTIIAHIWSPVGGELWKARINAALGLAAIWMTATIFVQQKRLATDRDRAVERAVRTERDSVTKQKEHRRGSLLLEAAEEGERARIAREVHDALGQPLAALKFDIEWLSTRLPPSDDRLRARVDEMESLVGSTISTVRRLATELRPSILDDIGLLAAMRSQMAEFSRRTGIDCELEAPPEEPAWPPDQSTTVYRILQESLTNVLRHARASSVRVSLDDEGEEIVLVVRDDGCGIPADRVQADDALGLRGMRERARLHEGTIAIAGEAGRGTTLTLRLPRKAVKDH